MWWRHYCGDMSLINQNAEGGHTSPTQNPTTHPLPQFPLSIFIKITQLNGDALPLGILNEQLVAEMFANAVELSPQVLN